ncbi:MAG TPA: IS21-like element helper ATPase IstB [Candidatus Paceibacterota bacterium]|nr:IS21-like element helper ATPase IstB [Candidatus Paceibacterota bacterium]
MKPITPVLLQQLDYLQLPFIKAHHGPWAQEATQASWSHVDYLGRLVEGEFQQRQQRTIQRRVRAAHFPVIKTLEQFRWDWPKKINRLQVQNLFRLEFLAQNANAIFLGNVGVGKTHLASALGYAACLEGHSVLFANAISVINDLSAAQKCGDLKRELKKYLRPQALLLDEIGYLPIDQHGADLLFQVISQRYERGSIILTTNKPFKQWPSIFNNDSTITSAVLDRLLHHAETVVIEGPSYRMKDQAES